MTTVLEARSLAKTFVSSRDLLGRPIRKVQAVKDVSLQIERGEILGVLGETGAGKSTVGRLLVRLEEPDAGSVLVDGVDVGSLDKSARRALKAKVRMVFQDPFTSLSPRMSVGDSVAEPLRLLAELDRRARAVKVAGLLESVGLRAEDARRYPAEFSGGQLQRIAIARAIATNPSVVVCDEPVASLDMSMRAQVINLLRDLQAERGLALVFISHDLSLVELIAGRVLVMYRGRVVESGTASAILAAPQHPYTRALVDAVPIPNPKRRALRGGARLERSADDEQHDLPGCDFADRCPLVMDICRVARPDPRPTATGDAACHLVEGDRPAQPVVDGAAAQS